MFGFALNHMTVAKASFAGLPSSAVALQCVGIEAVDELDGSLFDGLNTMAAGHANLPILALAEFCACHNYSTQKKAETESLTIWREIAPRTSDCDKSVVHTFCRSHHASTRCTGSILIRAGGVSLTAHHLTREEKIA